MLWGKPPAAIHRGETRLMTRVHDLRMAPKLLASFLLVAALAGLVGGTGLAALNTTHYWLTRISGDSVPSLVQLLRMREDITVALSASRGALLASDPGQSTRDMSQARAADTDLDAQFMGYYAGITHPGWPEAIRARRMRALLRPWIADEGRIALLLARHTPAATRAATRLVTGPVARSAQEMQGLLSINVQDLTDEVASRTASAEAAQAAAVRLLLTVVGGAVALAVALGLLLARSIAHPLRQIADTAARIAAGDASARIDLERGDELGVLARSLRLMVAHLQERATTDPLTGLGNHRAYHEEAGRALAHAARHGEPLTLALLDLDDFKLINDQHGHTQGDRVLAALGALLRGRRAEDRAFRLGGDEFALLLPATTQERAATALDRLRQEAGPRLSGATLSVGLAARVPDDGAGNTGDAGDAGGAGDLATLREQADAALYEAKRRGRNAVVTFGEIAGDAAIVSGATILAVRRLLAERAVTVAFQPIWDLERGVVLAYEALARPDPSYGLSGPQEAFDVAERIGRAHELDALCRAAILDRARDLPPDALLFLNLSPASLDHALLAGETLVEATAAAGLTPARVVLEITERSLTRPAIVIREATRLRALGFKIALDDVGAGNAGLEMLRSLPVDYLKIDRAVVAGAPTDTTTRSVLAAILAFAREAGTFVIAEGIETEAMLDFVDRAGREPTGRTVRAVQGYLLGRPSATISGMRAVPQARSA